jgi:hypothetical protein
MTKKFLRSKEGSKNLIAFPMLLFVLEEVRDHIFLKNLFPLSGQKASVSSSEPWGH